MRLYVDNTNIFVQSKTISDLYVLGKQAAASYNESFTSNRLTVNKSKILYLIFRRNHKMLLAHLESLKLDNVTVQKVQSAKFLNLLRGQHLSWDAHISNIVKNLAKFVPRISESRQNCT